MVPAFTVQLFKAANGISLCGKRDEPIYLSTGFHTTGGKLQYKPYLRDNSAIRKIVDLSIAIISGWSRKVWR